MRFLEEEEEMPKCPECGKKVPCLKKHKTNRPIECSVASLAETPEERREKIFREAKSNGLKIVKPYIEKARPQDSLYHEMVGASAALGNGENFDQIARALQMAGNALIKSGKGCVKDLGRLQTVANSIGFELNFSSPVRDRRCQARKIRNSRAIFA